MHILRFRSSSDIVRNVKIRFWAQVTSVLIIFYVYTHFYTRVLIRSSSADGVEHHVWLWDAAAGQTFGRSGRLHHRLPGEDRLVGQKQPAAGGRSDRWPAAARGNAAD